jgi:hypothetical protein
VKRSPADKPRLWPLRLVQFAPAAALGLFLGAWFAVPAPMRTAALSDSMSYSSPTGPISSSDSTLRALQVLELWTQEQAGRPQDGQTATTYSHLSATAWLAANEVMSKTRRLYGTDAARPPALPVDDPSFEAIASFESQTHGRVFAFGLPARSNPRVALSAISSLGVLTPVERRELEASGTLETLRHRQRGPSPSVLPVDLANLNGMDSIGYRSVAIQGHFYEVYSLVPQDSRWDNLPHDPPTLPDTTVLDSEQNRRALGRVAAYTGGAIFVIGPIDAEPVSLRLPTGATASPSALTRRPADMLGEGAGVRELDQDVAAQLGGRWVSTAVSAPDEDGEEIAQSANGQTGIGIPVILVAIWDVHPEIAVTWDRLGRTPLREFWVWLAARLPFVLSMLGVLLAVSLVVSPIAFVRERRLTAASEIEREQERIRREARESVVTRLTQLSARIDGAADEAADASRGSIAQAARDIDVTLADLRRILGELTASGERDE